MKEAHILEKVVPYKGTVAVFATFDEVFATEERDRLMGARTELCYYRVTPCPFKERDGG